MAFVLLRRRITSSSITNSHFLSGARNFCLRVSTFLDKEKEATQSALDDNRKMSWGNYSSDIHLPSLYSHGGLYPDGYDIELVDPDTWRVSSGLAQAWRDGPSGRRVVKGAVDEQIHESPSFEADLDFDEIEDMRIYGSLFYKLDRDSKEFEEYNLDFHRKKSSKNKGDKKESKKENPTQNSPNSEKLPKLPKVVKSKDHIFLLDGRDSSLVEKKLRTPTFNQLTAPYHEPFCLDIFISKGSVRACIIHRVTSKVVAVAHSISKDMKFDLTSTRNVTACAAVGRILAQRALADDIHDTVYTPRKGDKLEGKLQIVLQSIIDNGVNVKVKLKQRKTKKASHLPPHHMVLH